jgi:hypothetical protein
LEERERLPCHAWRRGRARRHRCGPPVRCHYVWWLLLPEGDGPCASFSPPAAFASTTPKREGPLSLMQVSLCAAATCQKGLPRAPPPHAPPPPRQPPSLLEDRRGRRERQTKERDERERDGRALSYFRYALGDRAAQSYPMGGMGNHWRRLWFFETAACVASHECPPAPLPDR